MTIIKIFIQCFLDNFILGNKREALINISKKISVLNITLLVSILPKTLLKVGNKFINPICPGVFFSDYVSGGEGGIMFSPA